VDQSIRLILLGLVGVLLGALLPFLMVIGILQPSFLVSFIAYAASLAGLVLGMLGSAMYARSKR